MKNLAHEIDLRFTKRLKKVLKERIDAHKGGTAAEEITITVLCIGLCVCKSMLEEQEKDNEKCLV